MWTRKTQSQVWLLVLAGAVFAAPASPQPANAPSSASKIPTLTNAAQILRLSLEPANANPPVRIQGIVTCYDHDRVFFVQDETAGVFVYHTGDRLSLRPGQPVRVTGSANRGRYTPIIISPVIQPLESGPAIKPQAVSVAQVQYGGLDAQWVELKAVVRSQRIFDHRLLLEVADPPNRIPVWIPGHQGYEQPSLVGSSVRLRGVVGARMTEGGQLEGFQIYANTMADVTVLHATSEDWFRIPLRPIRNTTSHDVRSDPPTCVRVRGIVTLCQPGRAVFIQDASGGLEVLARPPFNDLEIGTVVEAIGYPGPVWKTSRLEDAQIRTLSTNAAPQPVSVSCEELFQERHGNQLVEIEGCFLGRVSTSSNGVAFAVQGGNRFLTAVLDATRTPATVTALAPGCTLRLTGVNRVQREAGNPSAAFLLLRSPMDVKVVSPPPSNRTPAVPVLATATVLTGAGLLLALWFIQKQHRRTERLREAQAALQLEMRQGEQQLRRSIEERERIGRDLHDDIIQSIYAAGLGLEDCRQIVRRSPDQIEARLAAAIQTLNNTIQSVRTFITGLEPKILNGREFKTALKSLALTSGDSPTQFQFQVDPDCANRLTSPQATQLLHIAKEAMSNSLRHAHAASVTVRLQSDQAGLRLEIQDDGVGFNSGATGNKGRGLHNMAARAREIGGDLQTISAPGRGCCILVSVPQRNSNDHD